MEGQSPIRVAIVDDDLVLAEALTFVLEREPDLLVVALAHTGDDGVAAVERERPDVVLMDHHLPDRTGSEATREVTSSIPETAVVVMTMDASDEALLAAMEAGATGFLVKSSGVNRVVEVVRRAAGGEILFPASTMARLMGGLRERHRRELQRAAILDRLTTRETDVLRLMAEGLDTKAMAGRLVLSTTTVRTHVQSILSKLGAHSRLEAVARAADAGLLRR